MTIDDILSRLEGVRGREGQHTAKCPAHDDRQSSLSIGEKDGKILFHCFAGCSAESVADKLGLSMKDLFLEPLPQKQKAITQTKEAEYFYRDGKLRKTKMRHSDGSKHHYWSYRDNGGWSKGRNGMEAGLYQSRPKLQSSVFLVEGEKDVDNLKAAGASSVSLPDGASSKWLPEYDSVFAGKRVVILPDNDEPGRKYAQMCARNLHGNAEWVKLLDLTKIWPDMPEKADISDMMVHFGREDTIAKVMELIKETPEWEPEQSTGMKLVCAQSVAYEPPRWLIEPYFQRGKGTLIQADPGTGKTAFMCAIAAAVSSGNGFLGLEVETPGAVLMLSTEDDQGVLRGRIEANGGDLTKVFFAENPALLTLKSPEIEQAVKQIKAKLLVLDPLQSFLGADVDMFRANETRPVLAQLFEMCARNDCACAIVAHVSKSTLGKSFVNQSLGSVDIPGAMRSVLHVARNPENKDELVAVHVKSSNAPKGQSIGYKIVSRGGVQWTGFTDIDEDALRMEVKRKEKGVSYDQEPLVQVFNQLITDRPSGGFWSYSDLKTRGTEILGFPPFKDARELKTITDGISAELRKRDGLIIHVGEKQHGIRGVRIERYIVPDGYQASIQTA